MTSPSELEDGDGITTIGTEGCEFDVADDNVVVGGATGAVITAGDDVNDDVAGGETDVIGDCILPPPPPPLPLVRKFEFINAEAFEKSIIFS